MRKVPAQKVCYIDLLHSAVRARSQVEAKRRKPAGFDKHYLHRSTLTELDKVDIHESGAGRLPHAVASRTGDGKSSARGRVAYPHMHNVKLVRSRCGIKAPTSLAEASKS